ncbi:MAG TPA: hypothetical protein VMU85_14220 [Stellaceae bacterium]|nr:hypothetical protein [Stellaceae bacterium]
MGKQSVTHRIAMRMDFRHDEEMGCVLEVDTDEKGKFIVHFPEAQVWKLLTQLVQTESILRGARAQRRRKSAADDAPHRRAVA